MKITSGRLRGDHDVKETVKERQRKKRTPKTNGIARESAQNTLRGVDKHDLPHTHDACGERSEGTKKLGAIGQ